MNSDFQPSTAQRVQTSMVDDLVEFGPASRHIVTAGIPHFSPAEAKACSKVILIGEHAVVYGAPAIASPLFSMQISARIRPRAPSGSPQFKISFGGVNFSEDFRHTILDSFRLLNLEPRGFDMEGHSTLLLGAGLGSSAAFCVLVLRLLNRSFHLQLSAHQISKLANQLESRFHGTPSGLDTAVVAHEQVLRFQRPATTSVLQVRPPAPGHEWRFVLVDSGLRSPTLAMVKLAAPYFKGSSGEKRLGRFEELVASAEGSLAVGNLDGLAAAMEESGCMLQEAGVVPPPLEDLIEGFKALGIKGAKPTGAGGGGCILGVLDPLRWQEQVSRLNALVKSTHLHHFAI